MCVCYVAWKIELIPCYVLVGVVVYKNGWKIHERYANVCVLAEWYSRFYDVNKNLMAWRIESWVVVIELEKKREEIYCCRWNI